MLAEKSGYSTTAKDINAITQYQDQGMNVQDAIRAVMRDRECG